MNTIAWVLILAAVLIMRAVFKGRVMNIGTDLADAFTAVSTGDTTALNEILGRTGTGNVPVPPDPVAATDSGSNPVDTAPVSAETAPYRGNLVAAVEALGRNAKGYRFGATGPDYYDCSGLVWQGCKGAFAYPGARFTTFNILTLKAFTQVSKPVAGDIVVWPTHHMGVITGPDQMYSAESVRSGIRTASISSFRSLFGTQPRYVRYNG